MILKTSKLKSKLVVLPYFNKGWFLCLIEPSFEAYLDISLDRWWYSDKYVKKHCVFPTKEDAEKALEEYWK